MAGPAKKRAKMEAADCVRRVLINVAEYEAAVARLSDKETETWVSTMKIRLQRASDSLKFLKAKVTNEEYETIVTKYYTERLSKHPKPLAISITELAKIASTEIMAWEKAAGPELTLRQLQDSERVKKRELEEKRQLHVRSQTFVRKAELESVVGALESHIEAHAQEIKEYESQVQELCGKAYQATFAMNRAVESDLDIPGVGKYTLIPAPVLITSAQVKVADLASDLKAAGTDITVDAASNVVVPAPRSVTAVVKLDQQLSKIQLATRMKQFIDYESLKPRDFEIGDIGWFPVLRPTLSTSSSDMHTEFGYICAKAYPLIIVEKLDDCMIGLIISTSGGSGLYRKGTSIKSRSVPIFHESYGHFISPELGTNLFPRQKIRVDKQSGYNPPPSAYVDMLNTIMIPYDTRFKKEGSIVGADALPLQQMRLSAFLATTGAGKTRGFAEFRNWLDNWGARFGVVAGLEEICTKAKAEAREEGLAQAKAEAQAKMKAQVKLEEKKKIQMEAKDWEDTKARIVAKDREEARVQAEAKQREGARAQMEAQLRAEFHTQMQIKEVKLMAKELELNLARWEATTAMEESAEERARWSRLSYMVDTFSEKCSGLYKIADAFSGKVLQIRREAKAWVKNTDEGGG